MTHLLDLPEVFRLTLQATHQGVFDLNVQTGAAIVSAEYAIMLGYDPETFVETNAAWLERVHPEDRARVGADYRAYIERRTDAYRTEFRLRTATGEWKWILSLGCVVERTADGAPLRMVGTHTDITERKMQEARIARLARLYDTLSRCNAAILKCRSLTELAQQVCRDVVECGGFRMAWVGVVDGTSRRLTSVAGAGSDLDFLRDLDVQVDPEVVGAPDQVAVAVNALTAGRPQWHRQETDAGWTATAALPLASAGGAAGVLTLHASGESLDLDDEARRLLEQLAAQMGYAVDIYAQQQRQRETEAHLRLQSAALNATVDAIVIADQEGRILWINAALAAMVKFHQSDLLGRSVALLQPLVADRPVADLWAALRSGQSWVGEVTIARRDGSTLTASAAMTPVHDTAEAPRHFVAVLRDVTDAKRLQQEHLAAQKMEVVGRMAGTVAHDFNNLLGVINGTADLATEGLPAGDPLRADLKAIQQAGERAAVLTRQLLAFSRKQVADPQTLDMNAVLRGLQPLLQRVVGETIAIELSLGATSPHVRLDPGQFEQVIMNLVVNAKDAMPAGGRVCLETQDTATGVALVVRDTGSGIPPDVLPHIFEPFFTTKDSSKGTGLGLSTVVGIADSTGGRVEVASRVGEGSTFTVTWPSATRGAAPTDESGTPSRDRTVTVLVVEDDAALLGLISRMLKGAGYHVLTASSAEAAEQALGARPGRVDLLLTDVVMPGASGLELVERVQDMRPEMAVLYMSGYPDDELGAVTLAALEDRLIRKPFSTGRLLTAVREALAAPSTPQG